MAEYFVNNEQDIVKESLICYFWEKTPEIWENKPPKMTYGLLWFSLLVIDESNFWTSSDIDLPLKLSHLTEEQVSSILQQPNNF